MSSSTGREEKYYKECSTRRLHFTQQNDNIINSHPKCKESWKLNQYIQIQPLNEYVAKSIFLLDWVHDIDSTKRFITELVPLQHNSRCKFGKLKTWPSLEETFLLGGYTIRLHKKSTMSDKHRTLLSCLSPLNCWACIVPNF